MEEGKFRRDRNRTPNGKVSAKKNKVSLGLSNLGNTCYANSVIQALIHTKEFHSLLSSLNSKHMCRFSPTDEFWSICYLNKILDKGFSSDEPFLRAEEVLDIIK